MHLQQAFENASAHFNHDQSKGFLMPIRLFNWQPALAVTWTSSRTKFVSSSYSQLFSNVPPQTRLLHPSMEFPIKVIGLYGRHVCACLSRRQAGHRLVAARDCRGNKAYWWDLLSAQRLGQCWQIRRHRRTNIADNSACSMYNNDSEPAQQPVLVNCSMA